MGTHRLVCHSDTPARAIEGIFVDLERTVQGLWLRYTIEGALEGLALPQPGQAIRMDGLWRTTCLEAFVRDGPDCGYLEFNFSPSGAWAAYRFLAYRDGMEELAMETGPDIGLDASDSHLAIEATVPLGSQEVTVALTAVIEEIDRTTSYWALAHPPGKPDFHHPSCFMVTLAAPNAT